MITSELDVGAVSWVGELVRAVDSDNVAPVTCQTAATRRVLCTAPGAVQAQTRLTLADLSLAENQPLAALRSDHVAHHFALASDGLNVLVARMTVPGGPWPGHFGLEAAVFHSQPAMMPAVFPPARTEIALHFGHLVAASRGYRDGAGAVLFPEQLSVMARPAHQAFGVVFLHRLDSLFRTRVLPVLSGDTFSPVEVAMLPELRRRAFLAHERGHVQGTDLEAAVTTRRKRLAAVISELHADLDALVMLSDSADVMAVATANVLVADRIIREAWLRRPYAQVDAIAARQLLVLLAKARAVALGEDGLVRLDLGAARARLGEELERVRRLEQACCVAGVEPAREYLRATGWAVIDSACHRELESPLARFLGYAASRHAMTPV